MRITGYQPIRPRDIRGPQERAGFSVPAEGAAAPAMGVQPLTSVGMLVALAEADDESERRRRGVEQAASGIEALEAIEQDGRYEKVAEWARSLKGPAHPELAPLVRDIELRALVELAKAERDD